MAAVALELAAVELVHHLPPFSHALGRVTLDLASGMTETNLSHRGTAMHAVELTDATLSPHLRRVALLGHQDGVTILT